LKEDLAAAKQAALQYVATSSSEISPTESRFLCKKIFQSDIDDEKKARK
jgi:hypothetical protein